MKRMFLRVFLMFGVLLATIAPAGAQSLPTGVAFNVNLTEHASSAVGGYKIYILNGTSKIRTSDIGKPPPDARGTINHINPQLFEGLASGSYSIYTTAYGPGGESTPSNKVAFSIDGGSVTAPSSPTGTTLIHDVTNAPLEATRFEAEHFDVGGQGVAYYDLTRGNAGGAFRATDVDVEPTADSGGGYDVGWTTAGEWLNYTVTVSAAGSYDIAVRVASLGKGGTFHIEVDGVDVTGPMTVPNTGGWQVWTTVRRSGIALSAGPQLWRLVMDSDGSTGAIGNFNWIRAVPR